MFLEKNYYKMVQCLDVLEGFTVVGFSINNVLKSKSRNNAAASSMSARSGLLRINQVVRICKAVKIVFLFSWGEGQGTKKSLSSSLSPGFSLLSSARSF